MPNSPGAVGLRHCLAQHALYMRFCRLGANSNHENELSVILLDVRTSLYIKGMKHILDNRRSKIDISYVGYRHIYRINEIKATRAKDKESRKIYTKYDRIIVKRTKRKVLVCAWHDTRRAHC